MYYSPFVPPPADGSYMPPTEEFSTGEDFCSPVASAGGLHDVPFPSVPVTVVPSSHSISLPTPITSAAAAAAPAPALTGPAPLSSSAAAVAAAPRRVSIASTAMASAISDDGVVHPSRPQSLRGSALHSPAFSSFRGGAVVNNAAGAHQQTVRSPRGTRGASTGQGRPANHSVAVLDRLAATESEHPKLLLSFSADVFGVFFPYLPVGSMVSLRRVCRYCSALFAWFFEVHCRSRLMPAAGDWVPRKLHTLATDPSDLRRRRRRAANQLEPGTNRPKGLSPLSNGTNGAKNAGSTVAASASRTFLRVLQSHWQELRQRTVAALRWKALHQSDQLYRSPEGHEADGDHHVQVPTEAPGDGTCMVPLSIESQGTSDTRNDCAAGSSPTARDATNPLRSVIQRAESVRSVNSYSETGSRVSSAAPLTSSSSRMPGPGGVAPRDADGADSAAGGLASSVEISSVVGSIRTDAPSHRNHRSASAALFADTDRGGESPHRLGETERGRLSEEDASYKPAADDTVLHQSLAEASQARLVRFNLLNGLCDIAQSDRVTHLAPTVLPNGTLLLTRWDTIIGLVRTTTAGQSRPNEGAVDDDSENRVQRQADVVRWTRTAPTTAHRETVSVLTYHRLSGAIVTGSLDGTIKTWRIPSTTRVPRAPAVAGNSLPCGTVDYDPHDGGVPSNYCSESWSHPDCSHVKFPNGWKSSEAETATSWLQCIKTFDSVADGGAAEVSAVHCIDLLDLEDVFGRVSPRPLLAAGFENGCVMLLSCGASFYQQPPPLEPMVDDNTTPREQTPGWRCGWVVIARYPSPDVRVRFCRFLNHIPFPSVARPCWKPKPGGEGGRAAQTRRFADEDVPFTTATGQTFSVGDGQAGGSVQPAARDTSAAARPYASAAMAAVLSGDAEPIVDTGQCHMIIATLSGLYVIAVPLTRTSTFNALPKGCNEMDDPSDVPLAVPQPADPPVHPSPCPPWIVRDGLTDKIVSTVPPSFGSGRSSELPRRCSVSEKVDMPSGQEVKRLCFVPDIDFVTAVDIPPICHSIRLAHLPAAYNCIPASVFHQRNDRLKGGAQIPTSVLWGNVPPPPNPVRYYGTRAFPPPITLAHQSQQLFSQTVAQLCPAARDAAEAIGGNPYLSNPQAMLCFGHEVCFVTQRPVVRRHTIAVPLSSPPPRGGARRPPTRYDHHTSGAARNNGGSRPDDDDDGSRSDERDGEDLDATSSEGEDGGRLPSPPSSGWSRQDEEDAALLDDGSSAPLGDLPDDYEYLVTRTALICEATAAKISPTRPMMVVGLDNGDMIIYAVAPQTRFLTTSAGEVDEATGLRAPVESFPFFGATSETDEDLCYYRGDLFDSASGLRITKLQPAHQHCVASLHVDSDIIISVDIISTIHAYCPLRRTILWCLSQRETPMQPVDARTNMSEWLIAHELWPGSARALSYRNGVLVTYPVCANRSILIADFNGEFFTNCRLRVNPDDPETQMWTDAEDGMTGGNMQQSRFSSHWMPTTARLADANPPDELDRRFNTTPQLLTGSNADAAAVLRAMHTAPAPLPPGNGDAADPSDFVDHLPDSLLTRTTQSCRTVDVRRFAETTTFVPCIYVSVQTTYTQIVHAMATPVVALCYAVYFGVIAVKIDYQVPWFYYEFLFVPVVVVWTIGAYGLRLTHSSHTWTHALVPVVLRSLSSTLVLCVLPALIVMRLASTASTYECFRCLSWTLITSPLAVASLCNAVSSWLERRADFLFHTHSPDVPSRARMSQFINVLLGELTYVVPVVALSAYFDGPLLLGCRALPAAPPTAMAPFPLATTSMVNTTTAVIIAATVAALPSPATFIARPTVTVSPACRAMSYSAPLSDDNRQMVMIIAVLVIVGRAMVFSATLIRTLFAPSATFWRRFVWTMALCFYVLFVLVAPLALFAVKYDNYYASALAESEGRLTPVPKSTDPSIDGVPLVALLSPALVSLLLYCIYATFHAAIFYQRLSSRLVTVAGGM